MHIKTAFCCVLLILGGFLQAEGKDYEIPEIRIEVSVNTDGTVQVTERLTYNYDGSFSQAQYVLPRRGFTAISDIQISENGTSYINKNTEEPGTFSVSKNDESIRLRWHYNAENEQRTYTISYTLEGALTIGPEWSQFFWNYLSDDRDKSTKQLDILIQFPRSVSPDSLHGWTRSSAQQIDLKKSAGLISINATHIDDDDMAKVRALFPTSLLDEAQISITNQAFSLTQAEQEEQAYQKQLAEQKEWESYMADLWGQINYIIPLISIAVLLFLYQKYGKRHPTSRFSSQETIMTPDNTAPAVVGWLLKNQTITGGLLISTVLDLARRGYFKIEEHPPEEGFLADDDPTFAITRTDQPEESDLKSWERKLIHFVEDRLSESENNKLDKLFSGSSSKISKWYNTWKEDFKNYCYDKGWIDEESYTGVYWNVALQFILLCSGIAAIIFAGPIGLISTAVTAIGLIMSFAIIRRTPEGEEAYHRWNNYKKGLANANDYSLSPDTVGQHFIYGVAFGLKGEQIEHIITSNDGELPVFMWITFTSNTNSAAAIASSFSTLSATGTTSFAGTAGGAGATASAAGGGAAASAS